MIQAPGAQCYKTYKYSKVAKEFVPGKPLQPSLMLTSRANLSAVPFKCWQVGAEPTWVKYLSGASL